MSEWTRIQKTTIEEHLREEEKNIVKNNMLLALFDDKGLITFNHGGKSMTWRVRKTRNDLNQYGDSQLLNIPRVNRWEMAELPWRGYAMAESVTEKEKAMNKGTEAIIKFVSEISQIMIDDFRYQFPQEFFKDGNAPGNEERIHGFKSWLGVAGTNQYTAPSDTYAGISTALAGLGGAIISGAWPAGVFDPLYYAWSPLIVNYTHASWAATVDNWLNNCLEVLRYGILHQANLKGKQGALDLIIATAVMYGNVLDQLDDKERIIVERNGQNSKIVKLGFRNVVNYDGVDFTYDADCPDTEAYGLNTDSMELCCLHGQMLKPVKGFEIETLSDQYAITFFGNLKANPRSSVFWDNIT